jgi:hypothetical protein
MTLLQVAAEESRTPPCPIVEVRLASSCPGAARGRVASSRVHAKLGFIDISIRLAQHDEVIRVTAPCTPPGPIARFGTRAMDMVASYERRARRVTYSSEHGPRPHPASERHGAAPHLRGLGAHAQVRPALPALRLARRAARVEELSLEEILRVASELATLGCREGRADRRRGLPAARSGPDREAPRGAVRPSHHADRRTRAHRERARALADAGLSQVGVSIDGPAAIHDRLRGNLGSWAPAMRALENAASVGLGVSANSQINRLNMDHLEGMFETFHRAGVRSWQVQLTAPNGPRGRSPGVDSSKPWMVVPILDRARRDPGARGRAVRRGRRRGPHVRRVLRQQPRLLRAARDAASLATPTATRCIGRAARPACARSGSSPTAPSRAAPLCPRRPTRAGTFERPASRHIWAEDPRCASPGAGRTASSGASAPAAITPRCAAPAARGPRTPRSAKRGNYPFCYHTREDARAARLRERLVHRTRAPHEPYDFGRFELVLEPVP